MAYENNDLQFSPAEIWNRVQLAIKDIESPAAYKMWVSEIKPVKIENNTLYLSVPGSVHQEIVEKRYVEDFKTAISGIFDINLDVSIVCMDENNEIIPEPEEEFFSKSDYIEPTLNPKHTFDTFIVGGSNRFAHAASFAVADNPATAYNPLFIHGGTGLGKTHLMHAVGNYIKQHNPKLKVLYITSEQFTNELINSIKEKTNEEFRNKYRLVDVLMVDDIQFIADKESTQEEFFHTFNTLHSNNKQIILTSDRPPKEISTLEERLRTRFDWGIVADIQPPDYETRVAILKAKAQAEQVVVSDDMLEYISENVKTNVRELEGVLNRLKVFTRLEEKPINIDTVNDAIHYYKDEFTKIITPDYIIDIVCKHLSVTKDALISKRKTKDLVDARHIAMYFIREYTDLSLPAIGNLFGGRDHTTVLNALKRIETNLKLDDNRQANNLMTDLRNNIEDVM